MRRIIIDLDHTLLNTTNFKIALAGSLGLSMDQWNEAYQGVVEDNGGVFDVSVFLKGVSSEDRSSFDAIVKKLHTFLYEDSIPFLNQALAAGWEVVIVTFGNKLWQEKKLNALKKYLPKEVITFVSPGLKINHIQSLLTDYVIMIDDNALEIEAVKKVYPEVMAYWMTRPDGKYLEPIPQCPHQQINSLNQIEL